MAQLPDPFLQQFFERIAEAKHKFAQARAHAEGLEKAIAIERARIAKSAGAAGEKSFQKANSNALTHPVYEQAVRKYTTALEESIGREWDLKILEMEFGAWRTLAASQRAVM